MTRHDAFASTFSRRPRAATLALLSLTRLAGSLLSLPRDESKRMKSTHLTAETHARARIEFDGTLEFTHDGRTRVERYGNADAAREAVLDDVTAIAARVGGAVRLSTEGARGFLELWVHADGTVEQIPVTFLATQSESAPSGSETDPATRTPAHDTVAYPTGAVPAAPAARPTSGAAALVPPTPPTPPAPLSPPPATPAVEAVPLVPEVITSSQRPVSLSDVPGGGIMPAAIEVTNEKASATPPGRDTLAGPATRSEESPLVATDLDDDVERTVLVRRGHGEPTAPAVVTADAVVVLHSSSGHSYRLRGEGTLGRRPIGADGVALIDPQSTVSSTHLRFSVEFDGLVVCDLDSSNGTSITIEGESTTCDPGVEYAAPRGARLDLGSFFVVVV